MLKTLKELCFDVIIERQLIGNDPKWLGIPDIVYDQFDEYYTKKSIELSSKIVYSSDESSSEGSTSIYE